MSRKGKLRVSVHILERNLQDSRETNLKPVLRIEAVKEHSSAEESGLTSGDVIVSVGSKPVRDVIDFVYHSQDREIGALVRRKGKEFRVELQRNGSGVFGFRFEPLKPITCSNKCLFCFIDQLPAGLRETLYLKDEDYRLSFLHGNFITMTNMGAAALDRIVAQRLSPLYISVHATNPAVRSKLLGSEKGAAILPKLKALKRGRIQFHCQIVLCPGINDGAELERTIDELAELFPAAQSVAVVPVGLTRFRKRLPALKPVDRRCSDDVLETIGRRQKVFLEKLGTRFVFPADEFYLLSGADCPRAGEYESFPQLENGVGLVSLLLEKANSLRRRLRASAHGKPLAVLTGKLAEPICRSALGEGGTRVIGVENRFFGESITVTGLLTGQDILHAAEGLGPEEAVAISKSCLNPEGLFLDGYSLERVEELSGHRIIVEGMDDAKPGRSYSGAAKRGEIHAFQ